MTAVVSNRVDPSEHLYGSLRAGILNQRLLAQREGHGMLTRGNRSNIYLRYLTIL